MAKDGGFAGVEAMEFEKVSSNAGSAAMGG